MSVSNRNLNASYAGTLSVQYRRTDTSEAGANNTRDDVKNTDANMSLSFGTGLKQADLFYHDRITLSGPTNWVKSLDSGELTDIWGRMLDFNALKIVMVRNREATNLRPPRMLRANIKGDSCWIGPQGARFILEPNGMGLRSESESSSSIDEGDLIIEVTGAFDVTFDLFIVGSSEETSSSGT